MKKLPIGWIIAAALLSLNAYLLALYPQIPPLLSLSAWLICGLLWVFVLLLSLKPEMMENTGTKLNELRRAPAVALLLSLVLLLLILMLWGSIIIAEFSLFTLLLYFILLVILWGWGNKHEDRKAIGKAFERSRTANGLIALLSFFILFAFIELGFRYTMIYPDGFATTLPYTGWKERYYNPLNEFGHRGYMARSPEAGQQSVLVVGDSFAAGHGINEIDKVFAYQAEEILGEAYIFNLNAHTGASPSVAEFVEPYPVAPDILVLSHYINDIEHTGVARGSSPAESTPILSWFASRYFLFSYLYWHYVVGPQTVSSYATELLAAYDDEAKWMAHQARLQEFVDYANEREIPLLVIVWPTLNDLDLSLSANTKVADFFSSQGVTVVNIRPMLAALSIEQRIINNFDAHPNEVVQRQVAEILAEAILGLNQP